MFDHLNLRNSAATVDISDRLRNFYTTRIAPHKQSRECDEQGRVFLQSIEMLRIIVVPGDHVGMFRIECEKLSPVASKRRTGG